MSSSRNSDNPSQISSSQSPSLLSEDPEWEDEEDDDDAMDFEESLEQLLEDEEDSEGLDVMFEDASETQDESTSEGGDNDPEEEQQQQEDEEDDNEDDNNGGTETPRAQAQTVSLLQLRDMIPREQFLAIFNNARLRSLLQRHGNEIQFQIAPQGDPRQRRSNRKPRKEFDWPPVPHPEGQKLIEAGVFGTNEPKMDTVKREKKKLAYRTMMRELGLQSPGAERGKQGLVRQEMIPNSKPDMSINFPARGYCGQFSEDGNFFYTGSQDFCVRLYDTSNPYKWKHHKTSPHYGHAWTISDVAMSPDSRHVVSSTLASHVCFASTDKSDDSDPRTVDILNMGDGRRRPHMGYRSGGVLSLRFSGDGRELVAATNLSSIYVHDIEVGHSILCIPGHDNEVNAVCYGDKSSPHILFSGSDDTTIKIWDRRSLGDGRMAGAFLGHTEGITYVDSKGDGRYVISNSKDQTTKLWDLRKMIPPEQAERVDSMSYTASDYDYRQPPYPEYDRRANPNDCSLVTFRGHQIYNTLIRCHFSPPGSTDGRYVYSGSTDGHVWIWNLDGTLKSKILVTNSTRGFYDSSSGVVRDVSWHPNAPLVAATAWTGGHRGAGVTTVHSWNDSADGDEADPPMGHSVDHALRTPAERAADRAQAGGRRTTTRSTRMMPMDDTDDDDEDEDYED